MSETIFDPPRAWSGNPRTEADYWRRLAKIYEHGLRCVANTKTNPEGWATDQQAAEHYLEQGALTVRPEFVTTLSPTTHEGADR